MVAHRLYGNKSAMIATLFPESVDTAVKNRRHVITVKKYRDLCIFSLLLHASDS